MDLLLIIFFILAVLSVSFVIYESDCCYIEKVEEGRFDNLKITVRQVPNPIAKWIFSKEECNVVYVGSCTVWKRLPSFERASTSTEIRLSQVWSKWRYNKNLRQGKGVKSE